MRRLHCKSLSCQPNNWNLTHPAAKTCVEYGMNDAITARQSAAQNIAVLKDALAKVRSPRMLAFIRYMLAVHPEDRLPSRRDFEPLGIPALISGVVIVTVHRENGRHRFKMNMVGQDVIDAAPVEIGKRYLDEIVAEMGGARNIVETRQQLIDTGHTYLQQDDPENIDRFKLTVLEFIHCPLAADGETIDHIVSFFSYLEQEKELLPTANPQ